MITVHTLAVDKKWCRSLPPVLVYQLRLAHDLREDLVTTEYVYDEAKKQIWASFPQVGEVEAALSAAEEAAEKAAAEVQAEKVAQRAKRVTGPKADALKAARAEVKRLKQARRDAIAEVKDAADEQLKAAADARFGRQKQLRQEYCGKGMYWATANDVIAHHKTAVQRVAAKRAAIGNAQMRHHRFDGTGTIAVQVQRQAGQPPRTPATMSDGEAGKWRNVITLPWMHPDRWERMSRVERKQWCRGRDVRMRIGQDEDGPIWLTMPTTIHRMLPADADITGVRLTVTRTAGQTRASLSVTAKVPDPAPDAPRGMTAVHLGWRQTDDGVQVATWRSTQPRTVPQSLAGVVSVSPGGRSGRITLPRRWSDAGLARDQLKSAREVAFGEAREMLACWLDEHGPVPHPVAEDETISAGQVRQWRSPGRLAWLALQWRDDGPQIAEALDEWRASDRRTWETIEHGSRKAILRRRETYRRIAAWLTDSVVVLDDSSLADLARGAVGRSPLTNEDQQAIDRRRSDAAPGLLRELIAAAAKARGREPVVVSSRDLSLTHDRCGHVNEWSERWSPKLRCAGCGASYDHDLSAAANMLTRAASADGVQSTG